MGCSFIIFIQFFCEEYSSFVLVGNSEVLLLGTYCIWFFTRINGLNGQHLSFQNIGLVCNVVCVCYKHTYFSHFLSYSTKSFASPCVTWKQKVADLCQSILNGSFKMDFLLK
jgi:hypothetical protein